MEKREMFEFDNGEKKEIRINSLSFTQRNDIFGEFLNISKFMSKGTDTSDNIMDYLKEGANPLKFVESILKAGLSLEVKSLTSKEGDRLFEQFGSFIIDGGDSPSVGN